MDSYLNKTLGDFEIRREIGRGGMGVVYEAEQKSLRRAVALKILPPAVAFDQQAVERFEREALNAAKLHHPNIVPVYSVGSELGNHFYAMEYIDGKSLAQVVSEVKQLRSAHDTKSHISPTLLRREREDSFLQVLQFGQSQPAQDQKSALTKRGIDETDAASSQPHAKQEATHSVDPDRTEDLARDQGPKVPSAPRGGATRSTSNLAGNVDDVVSLSHGSGGRGLRWWRTIAGLIASAAEALQYAHGEGVIHRDIKPSNIVLSTSGRPLILDFGLSLDVSDIKMTVTGAFLGTPLYMSPEQASGRVAIDHRTDIYSLGVSLYELTTLCPPFEGSRDEIIRQIMFKDPPLPRRLYRAIPNDLQTIILQAIEKDPDRRYQTAGELADDLRRFQEGRPILAKQARLMGRLWRQSMRHKKQVAIAAAIVASLGVGLGAFTLYQLKQRELVQFRREQQLDEQVLRQREREIAMLEQQESREKLLQELRHDDPDKRSKAAKALGELEDRLARQGLEAAAIDTDAAVREEAVKALGNLEDRRSLKVLTAALDDSNPKVRVAAATALRTLQEPSALPNLIRALRQTSSSGIDQYAFRYAIRESAGQIHTRQLIDVWKEGLIDRNTLLQVIDGSAVPEVAKRAVQGTDAQRIEACQLLEDIGDGRAAEALLNCLEQSSSSRVKAPCAEALIKIVAPAHVPILFEELCRASNNTVWEPLDQALAAVPNQTLSAVRSAMDEADRRGLQMMVKPVQRMGGRQAVDTLIKMLELDNATGSPSFLSYSATRGLTDMHAPTVLPLFIELAGSSERLVRRQVVLGMGRFTDPRVPDVLIAALDDPQSDVRVNAVSSLSYQREPAATQKLNALTQHPDAQLRSAAVQALGRMGLADAVLPLLKDREPTVRANAAGALGAARYEPAVLPLISALKDPSPLVRQKSADALGRIAHTVAVDSLCAALEDTDEDVVREAATALGRLNDHQAIDPLVQAAYRTLDARTTGAAVVTALARFRTAAVDAVVGELVSKDSADRKRAAQLLGRLGHRNGIDALQTLTVDKASEVRTAAATSLGTLEDPAAAENLLKLLQDMRKPVRRAAIYALMRLPLLKTPAPVVSIATDQEDELNYLATRALGRFGDPDTKEVLIQLAGRDDPRVRREATIALARLKYPDASRMIRRELETANRSARLQLAQALAVLGTRDAAEVLAEIAHQDQPYVVKLVLPLLGSFDNNAAYEQLQSSLRHSRIEIRQSAARAIARLPDSRGVVDLVDALQDDTPEVILAVGSALHVIRDLDSASIKTELLQGLESDDVNLRTSCALRLRNYPVPKVVEALVRALDDSYFKVQEQATFSLGYLGDNSAAPKLRELTNHSDATIRGPALISLGRLHDDQALELLLTALTDPSSSVRRNAAYGIGLLGVEGSPQVAAELTGALSDADSNVRRAAAFALGEIGGITAIAELERVAFDADPEVAAAALKALIEAAGNDCVPTLLEAIRSGDPVVLFSLVQHAYRLDNQELYQAIERLLGEQGNLRQTAIASLAWYHQRRATKPSKTLAAAIDEQILVLRRRLALSPDSFSIQNDLAWLLAASGRDLDDALTLARRAVYLSPSSSRLDTLAEVHLVRGELTEALAVLRQPVLSRSILISPSFNYQRIAQVEQRLAKASPGK